jgi:hypothetical protein
MKTVIMLSMISITALAMQEEEKAPRYVGDMHFFDPNDQEYEALRENLDRSICKDSFCFYFHINDNTKELFLMIADFSPKKDARIGLPGYSVGITTERIFKFPLLSEQIEISEPIRSKAIDRSESNVISVISRADWQKRLMVTEK